MSMQPFLPKVAILAVTFQLMGGLGLAQRPDREQPKFARELAEHKTDAAFGADDDAVEVIVQYKNAPSDADVDRATSFGATVRSQGTHTRTAHMRISRQRVSELAGDPEVAYVTPDREVRASGVIDYSLATTGAVVAQSYGYTGKNVGVAIIDSGVAQ